jgi:nickel transport protein
MTLVLSPQTVGGDSLLPYMIFVMDKTQECQMKKNTLYKLLFSLVIINLLILISSPASAHKVNVFAYVEGDTVYCEGYFPDGRAVSDGKVEVYDSQGNKLLEGTTDKEGLFNFKAPKEHDLKIVLIASMGHKNSFTLTEEDFSDTTGTAAEPVQQVEQAPKKTKTKRHIPKKETFPVASVLGGLGFIFGVTALILQLTRKK